MIAAPGHKRHIIRRPHFLPVACGHMGKLVQEQGIQLLLRHQAHGKGAEADHRHIPSTIDVCAGGWDDRQLDFSRPAVFLGCLSGQLIKPGVFLLRQKAPRLLQRCLRLREGNLLEGNLDQQHRHKRSPIAGRRTAAKCQQKAQEQGHQRIKGCGKADFLQAMQLFRRRFFRLLPVGQQKFLPLLHIQPIIALAVQPQTNGVAHRQQHRQDIAEDAQRPHRAAIPMPSQPGTGDDHQAGKGDGCCENKQVLPKPGPLRRGYAVLLSRVLPSEPDEQRYQGQDGQNLCRGKAHHNFLILPGHFPDFPASGQGHSQENPGKHAGHAKNNACNYQLLFHCCASFLLLFSF